jgi:hypothetical protein
MMENPNSLVEARLHAAQPHYVRRSMHDQPPGNLNLANGASHQLLF